MGMKMEDHPRYKDVIRRDTVQCICNHIIIVYVFKNGEYRTIHKHNNVEFVPPNYVPLNPQEENLE